MKLYFNMKKIKFFFLSLFNKMLIFLTVKKNQNPMFFNIKIYIYHMDIRYKIHNVKNNV